TSFLTERSEGNEGWREENSCLLRYLLFKVFACDFLICAIRVHSWLSRANVRHGESVRRRISPVSELSAQFAVKPSGTRANQTFPLLLIPSACRLVRHSPWLAVVLHEGGWATAN